MTARKSRHLLSRGKRTLGKVRNQSKKGPEGRAAAAKKAKRQAQSILRQSSALPSTSSTPAGTIARDSNSQLSPVHIESRKAAGRKRELKANQPSSRSSRSLRSNRTKRTESGEEEEGNEGDEEEKEEGEEEKRAHGLLERKGDGGGKIKEEDQDVKEEDTDIKNEDHEVKDEIKSEDEEDFKDGIKNEDDEGVKEEIKDEDEGDEVEVENEDVKPKIEDEVKEEEV